MRESIEALKALTKEIQEGNDYLRRALFGDETLNFKGVITELADLKKEQNKMQAKFTFFAGAMAVVSCISPVIVGVVLKQLFLA